MKRTFELPDAAEVTVWTPSQPEVKVERGRKEELHRFASYQEAIEFYREFILALIAEGATELSPWLRYASETASYEVRVPSTRRFVYKDLNKKKTQTVQASFEDLRGALEAYHRFILPLTQERGCVYIPREWSKREGRPSSPWQERIEDGRRFFSHQDDPKRECGPEQHLHTSGATHKDMSQLEGQLDGARFVFNEQGQLTRLDHWLLGALHGPELRFYSTGVVEDLSLHTPQRVSAFWMSDEAGLVHQWSLDGYDEHKKRTGRWHLMIEKKYHEVDYHSGTSTRFFYYEADKKTLTKIVTFDEERRKHVRTFYADGKLSKEFWLNTDGSSLRHFDVYTASGHRNKHIVFSDEDPRATPSATPTAFEYLNLQTQARFTLPSLPLLSQEGLTTADALAKTRELSQQRLQELKSRAADPVILLGPWVRLRHPDTGAQRRLRLPVSMVIEEETRGPAQEAFVPEEPRVHRDHFEALLAYNKHLDTLLAQGWAPAPLEEDPFATLPHPGACFAFFRYTPEKHEEMLSREVYIASDDLQKEERYGLQRERFHNSDVIDAWYLRDSLLGWRIKYDHQGVMRTAQPMLGDEAQGRAFNLNEQGKILQSALYLNNLQRELHVAESNDNPVWQVLVNDPQHPGFAQRFTRYYRETQSLYMTGHFDHEKRQVGQWEVFWPNGAQKYKVLYKEGQELYRDSFDEEGKQTGTTRKPIKRSLIQSILEEGRVSGEKPALILKNDKNPLHLWLDPETKRVTRAGYIDRGSHDLYDEQVYAKPKQTPLSAEEGLSQVQALLKSKPSAKAWTSLCALMEVMFLQHEALTRAELLPVVVKSLTKWPAKLRVAPLLWINKLIVGVLPYDALHMLKALSFSAALGNSAYWNSRTPLLVAWLSRLPADTPALEGLHLSFRGSFTYALTVANTQEPDKRFHAEVSDESTYHWDHGVLEAIFQSKLASALRVVDLSFSVPLWDYYQADQGATDGRTASLERVSALLQAPEKLQYLDLQGNGMERSTREKLAALPNLKSLNLSQSNPIRDAHLTKLAKQCPNLEELDLVPNCLGWLLESGWPEDEEAASNVGHYWSFYQSDLKASRMSAKALKTLCTKLPLRALHLQRLYQEELAKELAKKKDLTVYYRSAHSESMETLACEWSSQFSLG